MNRSRIALAAVLALTAAAACGDPGRGDPLAQDSSLVRDLALANRDSMAQPQLLDVPVSSEPVATATPPDPAPRVSARRATEVAPARSARRAARPVAAAAPADQPVTTESGNVVTAGRGPEPAVGVIAAGETMELFSGQRVCTNTSAAGDRFTAMLHEAVPGSNGVTIPAGSTAIVEVISARRAGSANEAVQLEVAVRSIMIGGRQYNVSSAVTGAQIERVRAETRGDDVRKVATGAAIGAIAGQILGRKTKSTVLGAASGAAAGAMVAAATASYEGCIPSGGRIAIRLTEPLHVQM